MPFENMIGYTEKNCTESEWRFHYHKSECYAVVLADLERRRDDVIAAIGVIREMLAAVPLPSESK